MSRRKKTNEEVQDWLPFVAMTMVSMILYAVVGGPNPLGAIIIGVFIGLVILGWPSRAGWRAYRARPSRSRR